MPVTEGWRGHPAVSAVGADLIVAGVTQAAEVQRQREARDAEASAAAEAAQQAAGSFVSLRKRLRSCPRRRRNG